MLLQVSVIYVEVRNYGMNKNIGLVSFEGEKELNEGIRPYSKLLANMIDTEARQMVGKAYKETENLLRQNIDKLTQVRMCTISQCVLFSLHFVFFKLIIVIIDVTRVAQKRNFEL